MKTKKKFLVLGIGNAQVDLLQYLRKFEDIEIHALSNTSKGRGFSLVDTFKEIDISDKDAVMHYAENNKIDFIYSIGSDIAMPTVTWVAEKLNLKTFISSSTAFLCNNKHLIREKLKNTYGSVVFEILDSTLAVKNINFPAIVKPVDSQGQRGISNVTSKDSLQDAYEIAIAHSRSNQVIIEEKIEGQEISVHAYIKDGEIIFFLPSDRISWEGFDGGIIHKHILPTSISNKAIRNVHKLVSEIIESLSIRNGPVYFQIKINGDQPFLIEVTPRLDGCHMWRQIEMSTGIDLLDITMKHLEDKPFTIPSHFKIKRSTLEFLCQPPNEIFKTHKVSEKACYHEFFYQEGEKVKPINEKMEKCGFQILKDDR